MIIMDIDGTIADDRLRSATRGSADWNDYHARSISDPPIPGTIHLINAMMEAGQLTILLTGRPESARGITNQWLLKNKVMAHQVIMRRNDDWRPAPIVKMELVREYLKFMDGLIFIDVAFDSRDDVCEAYRAMGIVTAQVTAWPIAK